MERELPLPELHLFSAQRQIPTRDTIPQPLYPYPSIDPGCYGCVLEGEKLSSIPRNINSLDYMNYMDSHFLRPNSTYADMAEEYLMAKRVPILPTGLRGPGYLGAAGYRDFGGLGAEVREARGSLREYGRKERCPCENELQWESYNIRVKQTEKESKKREEARQPQKAVIETQTDPQSPSPKTIPIQTQTDPIPSIIPSSKISPSPSPSPAPPAPPRSPSPSENKKVIDIVETNTESLYSKAFRERIHKLYLQLESPLPLESVPQIDLTELLEAKDDYLEIATQIKYEFQGLESSVEKMSGAIERAQMKMKEKGEKVVC